MNKKGMEFDLAKILLSVGFVILLFSAGTLLARETSKVVDESACRASVFARDKLSVDVLKAGTVGTPLLCATKDKKLSGDDKEITKQIADLIARCWWQFGQGTIHDPFKEGTAGGDEECMVCYTVSLKNKDYKISSEKLLQYLSETTYLIDKESDKEVKYLEYVQSYGEGSGNIVVSGMEAPEVYAISYGDTTKECGRWCVTFGGSTAAAGAIGGGIAGAKVGAWIGGLTCTITGPGAAVCAAAGGAAGTVIGGAIGAIGLGTAGTYATASLVDLLSDRSAPTIYITRLQDVTEGNICNVHKV